MAGPLVRITHSKTGQTLWMEWVGSCDAPGMVFGTREKLVQYLRQQAVTPSFAPKAQYPEEHEETELRNAFELKMLERRLKRLDERGNSRCDSNETGEEFVSFNRAGPGEKELSPDKLIEHLIKTRGIKTEDFS